MPGGIYTDLGTTILRLHVERWETSQTNHVRERYSTTPPREPEPEEVKSPEDVHGSLFATGSSRFHESNPRRGELEGSSDEILPERPTTITVWG